MQTITRRDFLTLALGAIVAAATPKPAQAMPKKYRNCPTVKQNGISYLLYKRVAIVTKTPDRATVTIPDAIKHDGSSYAVAAIWDGTFSKTKKLQKIVLKCKHLDTIEDSAIWDRKSLTVICSDKGVYQWLRDTKAKARIKYRG